MTIVTLVGKTQAKVGFEFIYIGHLSDCKECRLKTVCFNLDTGRRYVVKAVRDVEHTCKIHEEGVRVVVVERLPIKAGIDGKLAIEGSTITYEERNCPNLECEHHKICQPYGLKKNEKFKIVKVCEDIVCPEKNELKTVFLE
ncbi:MAG: UPF0179 family protein [Candidatus Thermoplasmatota archaeon]